MFWEFFWWLFTPSGNVFAGFVLVIFVVALVALFCLLWRLEHGE